MNQPGAPLTAEQIAQLPYRPGVGIMLVNQKGQVFVAQRIDNPGPAWQMPQGGIDKREEPLQAAWRDDPTSFAGEAYQLHDIRFLPKPAHDIPIWVGGGVEAAFRLGLAALEVGEVTIKL